jgi:hypothetical protein
MDRFCGMPLRTLGWLICVACCAHGLVGCAGYSLRSPVSRQDSIVPPAAPTAASAAAEQPETASADTGVTNSPTPLGSGGHPPAKPVDPQDLPAVLAELESLGAIDVPTRDRLVADLKKTDPALWPQLLAYFKASLAYRQKYAPAEAAEPGVDSPAAPDAPSAAKPAAVATQATDEPALLSGVPNAKPLGVARAAMAVGAASTGDTATPASAASTSTARDKAINDRAVQTVAYQTTASSAEEISPSPAGANPPPVDGATASAAPAIASPAVGDLTPGAAAVTAAPALPAAASPLAPAVTASGNKLAGPAPAAEIDPLDWQAHLKAAIRGLERETAEPPATTAAISRHAGLRLLQLVDGDRDSALRPLTGVSATQQDFWSQQLFGLSTYLDGERTPDDGRRAAAAAVHLRDANLKLGDMATLMVRNLAFATEVHSYGVYKKFEHYEFHSGQEVLLYAEVENFKSAPTDQGFHTALRSSYQILDNRGARVDQKEFEITEEHCQNPRRDYFIRYFVWMPKRIYGGTYTLQLTIEDTLSQKIGQASIEFKVADKE